MAYSGRLIFFLIRGYYGVTRHSFRDGGGGAFGAAARLRPVDVRTYPDSSHQPAHLTIDENYLATKCPCHARTGPEGLEPWVGGIDERDEGGFPAGMILSCSVIHGKSSVCLGAP